MLELFTTQALIFFIVTLICVVLYTLKSIMIVKYSTFAGACITALAFGVNTIAVKLTADASLIMSIPYTVIANFLGVYIAKFLINKFSKDRLWRISCTISDRHEGARDYITNKLCEYNIEFACIPYEKGIIIDVFSKSQGESELIKEIINKHNIKYTVYEVDKTL